MKMIPNYYINIYGEHVRTQIPEWMKPQIWCRYVGSNTIHSLCKCCEKTTITFGVDAQYGHVVAASKDKKGFMSLDNFLPICKSCNSSMGSENLYDYKLRVYPDTVDAESRYYIQEHIRVVYVGQTLGVNIPH
jgi:5-methylcytosine-specific restriction endonuclease McrA